MSRQDDLIEANNRGLLTGQNKIDFDTAVERGLINIEFDPEGTGYDYESAKSAGLASDETGHWPSRNPQTGQLLKGKGHETFSLTEQGEQEAGFEIFKGEDGKYYSREKEQIEQPQLDIPNMTKSILDDYKQGNYSERKTAVFDELKKRGAFDAPQFTPKGMKEHAAYTGAVISSIPGSAAGVAKDIWGAVTHPIETAKGVGAVTAGMAQKVAQAAIPGEQEFKHEHLVDQMVEDFDTKFGGIDNAAEYFKNDPVRFVGDIAAVLSGVGGSFLKGTKAGEAFKAVSAKLEPAVPIAKGIKKTAETIPQWLTFSRTPSRMYQSAAKFSTVLDEKKRAKITQTALDNDITLNIEGLDKLWDKINNLNEQIADMVTKAEDTGKTMDIQKLFKEFDDLTTDALLSSKPITKTKAIKRIRSEIELANDSIGRKAFTAKEAQKFKQNVYKDIQEYYEKNLKLPDSVPAQKSVARMSKDFLETIIPGIKKMNKQDGDYISLMKALDRPISRIANHHLIGLGMTTKIATGTAIGGFVGAPVAGAIVGGLVGLLDHPQIKSRLAIVLNKMEKQGIDPGPDAKAFMNLLYEAKEIQRESK